MLHTLSSLAFLNSDAFNSPFIVPVAGCAMIACIIIATQAAATKKRQIESEERLAAIARGVTIPPTQEELAMSQNRPAPDAIRRRGNVRRAGIVLISSAIGIMLFFVMLTIIIGQKEILSGVACALVPLGIGVGLLIDARIQTREIEDAHALAASTRS